MGYTLNADDCDDGDPSTHPVPMKSATATIPMKIVMDMRMMMIRKGP